MKFLKILFIIIFAGCIFVIGNYAGSKFVNIQLENVELGAEKNDENDDESDVTKGLDPSNDHIKDNNIILMVIAKSADIREYHSGRSKTIVTMYNGELLKKIDYFAGWFRVITTTGEVGWCYEQSVKQIKKDIPDGVFPQDIFSIPVDSTELKEKIILKRRVLLPLILTKTKVSQVRQGPSSFYKVIDKTYRGELHYVYAYSEGWFEILMPSGDFGWVNKDHFDTIKNYDPDNDELTFGITDTFENMFVPMHSVKGIASSLKLHIGPEPEFSILKEVTSNQNLLSYGRSGKWYLIYDSFNKIAGWSHKKNLEISKYIKSVQDDFSEEDSEETQSLETPVSETEEQNNPEQIKPENAEVTQ
ncbi:SH3 domain-containing protein [Candidatus Dependentiae bacterium]|nr:SH3 domain-containing protein [Candidatus Dependentiae bacterium]